MYIFVSDMAHPLWHVYSELLDESLQNSLEREWLDVMIARKKNKLHLNVRSDINVLLIGI